MQWLGSSYDIVDSNIIKGEMLFEGKDASKINDIKDDAEFLGEAIKRKFTAEKIGYTSDIKVNGKVVSLSFQLTGMEPLWKKLFSGSLLAFLNPNY